MVLSTCCSLIWRPQWYAPPLHHKPFWFASNFLTCFRISTPQNPISANHFLAVNFFCPVAESPAIAAFVFIAVLATFTKIFHPVTMTMTPLPPPPILNLSEVLPPSVLPETLQLLLQATVSARISTFDMGGLPHFVCFCGACVFISSLQAAPYQLFKNMVGKPSHLPVLWIYPCFHNSAQLWWRFFLTTEDWAKDWKEHGNNWYIYCCFTMSCTVSS